MVELAAVLVIGAFAQWLAWKSKIPAILPLILMGLAVGPLWMLISPDGTKLLNPDDIFAGKTMYYFVSLSVGVILFEGGLTLRLKEVREVAGTVRNLLFFGTIIMLLGGGAIAYWILDLDFRLGLLFGALIIVTGPTVIAPILASVKPNKNISTILKWEGILIDPIGALVAVLVYELLFVSSMGVAGGHDHAVTVIGLQTFLLTLCVGTALGLMFGYILHILLKRRLIPDFLDNVLALGLVIFCFAAADVLQPESGLLAVTVMGIFLANIKTPDIDKVLHFKESLTVLLISVLFIILSSNLDIEQLQVLNVKSLIVFVFVVFVLRPLVVWVSSLRSNLNWREKLFIAWIGPKGIVAAAVASLFSLYLLDESKIALPPHLVEQVEMIVPLTFLIILGTVLLNGLTAKILAKWLNVGRTASEGFLIIGANSIGIHLGKYIRDNNFPVTLIDTSSRNIAQAEQEGLTAVSRNILAEDFADSVGELDAGTLLATTSSNDINIFGCRKLGEEYGEDKVFRLITANEMKFDTLQRPKNILFGGDADYIRMVDVFRKHGDIQETSLRDEEHFQQIMKDEEDLCIPLFLKTKAGKLKVITASNSSNYEAGDQLAFLGKLGKYE